MPVIGKELMCYCIMILCSSVLSQGLQQCTVPVSVGGGVDMSRLGSLSYVAVSQANDFSSGWCLCQGRDGCVSVLGKGLTCCVLVCCLVLQCPKPVIAAVHGACVGGGIDMVSACDIRYCSSDAWFSIKVIF